MRGHFLDRVRFIASLLTPFLLVLLISPPVRAASPATAKKLIYALNSPSFKVRLQAAILIGKKEVFQASDALREALDDQHDAVRAAAALSLGKLGDAKSRSKLVSLLKHKSQLLVRSIEKALMLLDKKNGEAVFLVAIEKPRMPKGVARSRGARLMRTFKRKLENTGGIVLSAGEENIFSKSELDTHLKKRKLTGILLQPKISRLKENDDGSNTTVICKVSIMVVTLLKKRMEFSGGGEADAWIEDTDLSDDDRQDLENTVLDAAADAAIGQVIKYLARRAAGP